MPATTLASTRPTGSRLVTADGSELPLRGAQLHTEAGAGFARTRLIQRFANPRA
jgi:hypothetical protein